MLRAFEHSVMLVPLLCQASMDFSAAYAFCPHDVLLHWQYDALQLNRIELMLAQLLQLLDGKMGVRQVSEPERVKAGTSGAVARGLTGPGPLHPVPIQQQIINQSKDDAEPQGASVKCG